ncbi:molybdopterin-dependent oxidoreductase [Desulfitobacterium metallireducens]|uniref:Dehydrogenase n=1 Tax=Desulfitobacterium metallireducens DSM 15288 TaxID=871968 RepID=W0EGK0_9FIRM|nr:molybdopterin-dependent oxidoreductase [Desulfitobacterium metallireducens]AHF08166.1 dehydrogenase [Desulfitobacterium metallireducens DSM 15288]
MDKDDIKKENEMFLSICPRNCYETCGLISHVQNGRLIKVEGDPHHGYTQGKLCAKGYAYTEYVYSPQRLRHPLRQVPRGSGNWYRISWEEALEDIANKILELHHRYGSSLACAYNKFSGNLGVLHNATEGMFRGLGSHTKLSGNACLAAGSDAVAYNRGQLIFHDPEDMAKSKAIVLWGVNPARTAVHQWNFINQARDKGAQILVIDPLYTPSAAQADIYLQINPGTDGLLAMAVLKILLEEGKLNPEYFGGNIYGWESFQSYLQEKVTLEEASKVTGVPQEGIYDLSSFYKEKPCATWVGFGLQRYSNGGQNIRCIDALVALSGNHELKGGGLYYNNLMDDVFKNGLLNFPRPMNQEVIIERSIDINSFAQEALALTDPPLKFLWIAGRNPLSQDQDQQNWQKLLNQLELVVAVDLFMNETTAQADIVLPAASPFEEYDLHQSYWHQWIAINQKAIPPFFEAKSDLEIARSLTKVLNKLQPNFSSFPDQLTALDWIAAEFTPEILERLGIAEWQELLQGPRKLKISEGIGYDQGFQTEMGKLKLYSPEAKEHQLPALARFLEQGKNSLYSLRLLTPQSLFRIHSQYRTVSWLSQDQGAEVVEMNPYDAEIRGIKEKESVSVFNDWGNCQRKVKLNDRIPQGVIVIAQSGKDSVNQLLAKQSADMGTQYAGSRGAAYYDAWVEVERGFKREGM